MLSKKSVRLAKLLKNLYNHKYIQRISFEIKKVYIDFETEAFEKSVFDDDWKEKELKERMRHISTLLGHFLPKEYKESIEILKKAFLNITPDYSLENIIFQDFVEVYGLDDFNTSMDALEHFTIGSTSEFAIRRFILRYPHDTMRQMQKWSLSSNEHVRRLSSEGCRSRLPWSIALNDFKSDPSELIKILEVLKDDESAYVRKSVANSLNDISKDNPDILKAIAKSWINKNKKRDSLLKHACRTLLKSGDREVLELFGFRQNRALKIDDFKCFNNVAMGSELEFAFTISSNRELRRIRVEYVMNFLRSDGKYSKKVFKVCEGDYESRSIEVSKRHSFKKLTTRKYYPGLHKIEIVINGDVVKDYEFMLEAL